MIPTVSKMEIEHILILEFGDENDVLTRLEREFLDEEMTFRKPSKLKWRRIMIQHTFHEWSWCRHISHADEDGKGQRLGPREGKVLRECYLTQTKFPHTSFANYVHSPTGDPYHLQVDPHPRCSDPCGDAIACWDSERPRGSAARSMMYAWIPR
ncbi:uncharacterized protein BJ212DRAFT_1300612 [Suillus subaureus]|uniref:Uncharacterized protein n=1 Tax=Suillus subaureus TaxID=48587 RepID=A0A9P7JCG7_9AGAM|nr:uncharacterized protein BJ212DRAFT_1300612 [Suillus subaureus]KAG1814293.1 hypothetical protein BJ212DRAFT_1300612 [Suillus subaureus]